MIKILCVDDHPVVLDGLSAIIAMQPEMELAATASSGETALKAFREHRPDVTLVDLRLPDMSGFELIKAFRKIDNRAKAIVLSSYDGDADIQRALDAGAQGYVAKGLVRDELLTAIRTVSAGGKHIPASIAQRLVGHMQSDAISERESASFVPCGRWKAQQGDRRRPLYCGRHRQNACPEYLFQTRRHRSNRSGDRCAPARHYSSVDAASNAQSEVRSRS